MTDSQSYDSSSGNRIKFIIGGIIIFAAVIYLIISSTRVGAQYFLTVDEVISQGDDYLGRDLKVSGAVIGNTIEFNPETLTINFDIAHIPGDNKEIEALGGLGAVLNNAVTDHDNTTVSVVYVGPKPDLLKHEAQAILTGQLGEDGIFYADELLLKCPTKYEDAVPEQADG
jgi:cytochrome c-type biogenesis protein CcmE